MFSTSPIVHRAGHFPTRSATLSYRRHSCLKTILPPPSITQAPYLFLQETYKDILRIRDAPAIVSRRDKHRSVINHPAVLHNIIYTTKNTRRGSMIFKTVTLRNSRCTGRRETERTAKRYFPTLKDDTVKTDTTWGKTFNAPQPNHTSQRPTGQEGDRG